MSQFWQNLQARLQPAVPKESTALPGRKWFRGFFSTGSTQKPLERPYDVSTIWSSTRARTKQSPRWPSCSRQARGQTSHWILPSSSRCHHRVGTVNWSSRLSSVTGVHLSVHFVALRRYAPQSPPPSSAD